MGTDKSSDSTAEASRLGRFRWQLRLDGAPRLLDAAGGVVLLERRDGAMLAFLAIEGPTARQRLLALLWPDEPEATLRNRLRQRVFALKQKLHAEAVEGTRTLALGSAIHWAGLAANAGDKLPLAHQDLAEAPELAQWLMALQEHQQLLQQERLAETASRLEQEGRLAEAIEAAQQLVALRPLQEHAHRRLMRLHYLRGDRAAALEAFDRCERILRDDLSARPGAETVEMLAQIEKSRPQPQTGRRHAVPVSILRPPNLIGRDWQWSQLLAAWNERRPVILEGEAGMGKTRLIDELSQHVGAGLLLLTARPGDGEVPYAVLMRLLRAALQRIADPLPAEILRELARLLPELGDPPDTGSGSEARLLAAVESLLDGAARAGTSGVVVDDLHYIDDASVEALSALVEGVTPWPWVLSCRPAEISDATGRFLRQSPWSQGAVRIDVPPFDQGQIRQLVDSLGLQGLDGNELSAPLLRHAGGNPMFVLDTLKSLTVDPQAPRLPGGSWVLPVVSSIAQQMLSRLGRLGALAVNLARCAAIAGPDFSSPLASELLDVRPLALADAWRELEDAQVLRDGGFAHDLVYEAVLRSIPEPIARHTHALTAAYLGEHGGGPARIADHWQKSDQPANAAPWLKRAAELAGQALRAREQVDFLLLASSLQSDSNQRAEAFDTLCAAMQVEGKMGRRLDLELVDRLEGLAESPRQIAFAAYERGAHFMLLHRFSEAEKVWREAWRLAEAAEDVDLASEAQHGLGLALAIQGHGDEGIALMLALTPWMQTRATPTQRGQMSNNLAVALDMLGRMEESRNHHDMAIRSAIELRAWSVASIRLANLGANRQLAGRFDQALLCFQQACDLVIRYDGGGESTPTGVSQGLAVCCRVLGDYTGALRWAEENLKSAQADRSDMRASRAKSQLAAIWVDLGQRARAEHLINEALAAESMLPDIAIDFLYLRARLQRWHGQSYVATIDAALDKLKQGSRPDLRNRLRLERARDAPDGALEAIGQVIAESESNGQMGLVAAAWAARTSCLWPRDPLAASKSAIRAVEMAHTYATSSLYRPELLLDAARAFDAAGDREAAQAQLAAARAWLDERIRSGQIPEPFVDSFLHRNPINRAVLLFVSGDTPSASIEEGLSRDSFTSTP